MSDRVFCLFLRNSNLSKIIEGSQLKYPIRSQFSKYLSFRAIHKVWKFETNQRKYSTELEWNKLNSWGTDPGLWSYISNYSSADNYLPCDKSFRSRATELQRYLNLLFILCGRWMPEYLMGLALTALWFCAQRTKHGWKQHTQAWGGWVHSTALTLWQTNPACTSPDRTGGTTDDMTAIRVFLLPTSIISRALPALAMEGSPTALIGSKAPKRNGPSDLSINLPTAQTLFRKRPFRWTKFSVPQNSDTNTIS